MAYGLAFALAAVAERGARLPSGLLLTTFAVLLELVSASVLVRRTFEPKNRSTRPVLAAITTVFVSLLIADAARLEAHFSTVQIGEARIVGAFHGVAFATIALTPIILAGRRIAVLLPAWATTGALVLLTAVASRFVLPPMLLRNSLGWSEIVQMGAAFAAGVVSLGFLFNSVSLAWSMYRTGALVLVLTAWGLQAGAPLVSPTAIGDYSYLWCAAVATLSAGALGAGGVPDVGVRQGLGWNPATLNKLAILGNGLVLATVFCLRAKHDTIAIHRLAVFTGIASLLGVFASHALSPEIEDALLEAPDTEPLNPSGIAAASQANTARARIVVDACFLMVVAGTIGWAAYCILCISMNTGAYPVSIAIMATIVASMAIAGRVLEKPGEAADWLKLLRLLTLWARASGARTLCVIVLAIVVDVFAYVVGPHATYELDLVCNGATAIQGIPNPTKCEAGGVVRLWSVFGLAGIKVPECIGESSSPMEASIEPARGGEIHGKLSCPRSALSGSVSAALPALEPPPVELTVAIASEDSPAVENEVKLVSGRAQVKAFSYYDLHETVKHDVYDVVMVDDPWVPELADQFIDLGTSQEFAGVLRRENLNLETLFSENFLTSTRQASYFPAGHLVALPLVGNVELLIFESGRLPLQEHSFYGLSGGDLLSKIGTAYGQRSKWAFGLRGKTPNDVVEIYWQVMRAFGFDDQDPPAEFDHGGALLIDCATSRRAIEWLRTLAQHGAAPESREWGTDEITDAMAGKRPTIGMTIAWPYWFAPQPNVVNNKDVHVMAMSSKPVMGLWMLAVPKKARHLREALELVVQLTTNPARQYNLSELGAVPVLQHPINIERLLTHPFWASNFTSVRTALEHAKPRPRTPRWLDIETRLGNNLKQAIFAGEPFREDPDAYKLVACH